MNMKILQTTILLMTITVGMIIRASPRKLVDFDEEAPVAKTNKLRILTSSKVIKRKSNDSSKNMHKFFDELTAEKRKLMGAPDADIIISGKMKNVFGGLMSVKMPDNPAPIFVNQNPFYAFR